MGSGASKKAASQAKEDERTANLSERRANIQEYRPDTVDFVLADASRPEWEQGDVFVFSIPPNWATEKKKQGRFYSRLYRFIGSWKMEQNCLFIRWDQTNKYIVF